ncbi:tRNA (cytidine(56)-2'-O)-methyltransferase [Halobacterium salinarum]|uniref:tRNA (cytidine(56)-2'-O)-methyltransferase n=1 Tax=Halobacterium salinarum TaxID=2242 RepID=UPI002554FC9A|nr:tRNA (cytidine(56)-2'-O)-methyltransferase [Halobacterium salinarum]MDL0130665.1 tRNA (cytidine(56)-2'-O)-methyltransferase [Halobacterium salinarum]
MQSHPEVAVLRYGHRPGRDDRMTTHVGLTARALGADRVLFPDNATQAAETVRDITGRFGGPFDVERTTELNATIEDWPGVVVHLTMYGEQLQSVDDEIRTIHREEPVLVVVGGEKVPGDVYEAADWNVGVTNQPHSEVAGLAVFLDRLFDGRELEQGYENAERRVIPEELGKHVVDVEDGDHAEGAAAGDGD